MLWINIGWKYANLRQNKRLQASIGIFTLSTDGQTKHIGRPSFIAQINLRTEDHLSSVICM
jgi:hypothetical protein